MASALPELSYPGMGSLRAQFKCTRRAESRDVLSLDLPLASSDWPMVEWALGRVLSLEPTRAAVAEGRTGRILAVDVTTLSPRALRVAWLRLVDELTVRELVTTGVRHVPAMWQRGRVA